MPWSKYIFFFTVRFWTPRKFEQTAGTWINLQDAYVLEKAGGPTGDWFKIGYSAPGIGSSNDYKSDNFEYDGGDGTWQATARKDLNDCTGGSGVWKMKATAEGTNVQYEDDGSTKQCANLTPAWAGLTRSSK